MPTQNIYDYRKADTKNHFFASIAKGDRNGLSKAFEGTLAELDKIDADWRKLSGEEVADNYLFAIMDKMDRQAVNLSRQTKLLYRRAIFRSFEYDISVNFALERVKGNLEDLSRLDNYLKSAQDVVRTHLGNDQRTQREKMMEVLDMGVSLFLSSMKGRAVPTAAQKFDPVW